KQASVSRLMAPTASSSRHATSPSKENGNNYDSPLADKKAGYIKSLYPEFPRTNSQKNVNTVSAASSLRNVSNSSSNDAFNDSKPNTSPSTATNSTEPAKEAGSATTTTTKSNIANTAATREAKSGVGNNKLTKQTLQLKKPG